MELTGLEVALEESVSEWQVSVKAEDITRPLLETV